MSESNPGYTIAKIRIGKKKITVTLDDGMDFVLSPEGFTEQPLYEGKILGEEEKKALVQLASEDKYRNLAARFVTKDGHTVYQAKLYLIKKGADAPMANRIVKYLEELGYLDDRLYASTYARDVAGLRLYGRNRILAELKEDGISDGILADLVFSEESELSKARRYARMANKKYAKNTNVKKMSKVFAALLRRGFDTDIAREAARLEFTSGDPELERQQLQAEVQRAKARYSKAASGYALYKKMMGYLIRRGYPYESIKDALKEMEHEDF